MVMGKTERQKCNYEILRNIIEYVEKYPDQRFHQILYNMKVTSDKDIFYEESSVTLKAVLKRKEEMKW